MKIFFVFIIVFSTLLSRSVFAVDPIYISKYVSKNDFDGKTGAVYLSSGLIYLVNEDNKSLRDKIHEAIQNNSQIKLNENDFTDSDELTEIDSFEIIPSAQQKDLAAPAYIEWSDRNPLSDTDLTLLETYQDAQGLMDKFNGQTRDESECYNRAHVWAYESIAKSNVNLGKIWIFFTSRYIREFRYKWWFHVAPFTEVGSDRYRYVLDRGFTMIPYNVENWKNIFMKNSANCVSTSSYTTYESNQESAYCYLIYSNQYYWQPLNLESLTKRGVRPSSYQSSDLKIAYRDALITWNGIIPSLSNRQTPISTPAPTPTPTPFPRPSPDNYLRAVTVGETFLAIYHDNKEVVALKVVGDRITGQGFANPFLRKNIALTNACKDGWCTGMRVTVPLERGKPRAEIIGIDVDGRFVIKFLNTPLAGGTSAGWEERHLRRD